jgi:2-oxoglutarate/2-oxoacid ferredoxin oxidoreductase subunit beta
VDYELGTTRDVRMPDGSHIVLKKLDADYDPTNRDLALTTIRESQREQRLVTGLLYVDPTHAPFQEDLHLEETPLAQLPLDRVRPPREVLETIMEQLQTGRGIGAGGGG